jgi:hypothetical protein
MESLASAVGNWLKHPDAAEMRLASPYAVDHTV